MRCMNEAITDDYAIYNGDCVELIDGIPDNSLGLSVFSPPFPGMYTYTNSPHDMGNCKDNEQMIKQFAFFAEKLLDKMMPGRSVAIHLTQGTAQKLRDGKVGLKDFRGQVIQMMESVGFIYYGEVCIDKNPQVKAIRTKDHGLMFKTLSTDSAKMHMALADYMLQFRKPGDNQEPIRAGISAKYNNENGWISQDEWIRWARPVWYADDFAPDAISIIWDKDSNAITVECCDGKHSDGIKETDVLNVRQARETNDERHLCPLQLGVIERAIKLWSNPGDTVLSPFAGIGSEGYQAIKFDRKFVGFELKESYYLNAIKNLDFAIQERSTLQNDLFSFAAQQQIPV